MKINTHSLYVFIICLLLCTLVYMYTSSKKVETTTSSIDTTPPVESPLPLETTPPPDDESTTDEKSENIYDDKYFTVTVYLNAVSIYLFTIACTFFAYDADTVGSVFMILCICLLIVCSIMSIISLCVDSLHTKQLVLMILSVVPFPVYITLFVTFIKKGSE